MKKLILSLVVSLLLSGNAYALEKAIFAFTVDEQVQTFKEGENLITNKSSELNSDNYWNTPLTKLDYYLIQIKQALDEASKDWGKEFVYDGNGILIKYFEKIEVLKEYQKLFGKYEVFKVSNDVYYDEAKGKIVISFSIDNVGKAKKPMKEICQSIITGYIAKSFIIPSQKLKGYSSNERLLNELYRGGSLVDYNKHLEKIANNITYILRITSTVYKSSLEEMDYDMFNMTCYKLRHKDEIIYRKWSSVSK